MISDIIRLLRKSVISNSGVTSLVKQRVYPTHIAMMDLSKAKDIFPCITIHYNSSKKAKPMFRSGWHRFLIQYFSDEAQEVCYQIHDAMITALQSQAFSDDDYYIQVFEDIDQGIDSVKFNEKQITRQSVYWKVYATKRNSVRG